MCLGRAETLAEDLQRLAPEAEGLREDRIRILLLLALRERQLGILGDRYLGTAGELLKGVDREDLQSLANVVEVYPPDTDGVVEDRLGEADPEALEAMRLRRRRSAEWLEARSGAPDPDPVTTVFVLALARARGMAPDDMAALAPVPPEPPPLVAFSRAWALGDGELAESLLEREPTFHEAHLILGRQALAGDRPALAEKELRQTLEVFPASLAAGMGWADALVRLEELELALEAYEGVLAVAPSHRAALLRKGIVLSQLGRGEEAIRALERLVDLGFWYLGEAHYWLAWNEQRAEMEADAHEHIELAKHSLPDDPRVHELDGRLELHRGDLAAAEQAFLTVLELDARWPGRYAGQDALCDALVALGRIESDRDGWDQAASLFERAAYCNGAAAALLDQDLERVRGWSLPPAREAALAAKKRRLRDEALRRRAGYLYNAAASALNARKREWCLGLARRAAEHPAYKEKAEALIDKARFAAF